MLTCSALAVGPILGALNAAGVEPSIVVTRLGVAPERLLDSDARFPVTQFLLPMWELAEELSDDPLICLHAVENVSRESFDVFSYIVCASTTMGEAAERVIRYFRLISEGGVYELKRVEDNVWWYYRPRNARVAACRQDSMFALCVVVACIRLWLDTSFAPLEVRLPFVELSRVEQLEAFFRAPIRLGMEECAILFGAEELDRPFTSADPQLAKFLERFAEGALAALPEQGIVSSQVREVLVRQIHGGETSLKFIARKLALSERSLQRQLRAENTSLKEIAEELRRELATSYLRRNDFTISEVAYMLGFSETAPFFRAFKKWTGLTPGDFRRSENARMTAVHATPQCTTPSIASGT